jgi:hypothetical protein
MLSWAPHWQEDLSFQACAPMSSEFQDAPLHFAKGTDGNVRWCSENYPTQADMVDKMDRVGQGSQSTLPGQAINFTSHVVKKTVSPVCTATIPNLPTGYPAAAGGAACAASVHHNRDITTGADLVGVARHDSSAALIVDNYNGTNYCSHLTCDRTGIIDLPGGVPTPPLLAPPAEVTKYLIEDPNMSCLVTWDNNQGKAGKKSPTGGCCHSDVMDPTDPNYMKTGAAGDTTTGILGDVRNGYQLNGAHLEPGVFCQAPQY